MVSVLYVAKVRPNENDFLYKAPNLSEQAREAI